MAKYNSRLRLRINLSIWMLKMRNWLLFFDYLSDRLSVFLGEPAVKGTFHGPLSMDEGMNLFLKDLGVTFRRDPESHRPRANDIGSQMDQKQKSEGKLYYT